jgi:hypothetical protein
MEDKQTFNEWAIVEIMGHQKFAGRVSEQIVAGSALLRIDIPAQGEQVGFTKLFGMSSVYAITPTTEQIATAVASKLRQVPIGIYDLPESMQAKLRAPAAITSRVAADDGFEEGFDGADDRDDDGDEPY